MAKRAITIQLEPELIEAIDAGRGATARQEWIATACRHRLRTAEQALSEAKEPEHPMRAGPGSVPSSEGVRPAAPAEQPKSMFRGPEAEAETLGLLLGERAEPPNTEVNIRGNRIVPRRHLSGCKCPVCK